VECELVSGTTLFRAGGLQIDRKQVHIHALTGQILLGCLVPRPILGRARRLLEGSRGVWGGGPKETSEK